jgi:hypothetical protein
MRSRISRAISAAKGATGGGCSHVQKSLVQRQALDKRSVAAQDSHELTGGLAIGIRAGTDKDRQGKRERAQAADMAE